MTATPFTLGLIQMRMDADPRVNLDAACHHLERAAQAGGQILCLPELFCSRYFCQKTDPSLFDLSETIPGPSTLRLGALAKGLGRVVVASLFERRAPGLYHNTAVVFDADGSIAGLYRKNGPYWYVGGWNPAALIAMAVGMAPCIPGFLAKVELVEGVDPLLARIYDYAWFVSFGVSFVLYLALMTLQGRRDSQAG